MSGVYVRTPFWVLLLCGILLPAVAMVLGLVFVFALVIGLTERLATFLWRWPTFTIFFVMALALSFVVIGAFSYGR